MCALQIFVIIIIIIIMPPVFQINAYDLPQEGARVILFIGNLFVFIGTFVIYF